MRERPNRAARAFLAAGLPLLVVGLLLSTAACGGGTRTETVTETVTETITVTETVTQLVTVVERVGPFLDEWEGSGHADATAEAFRHWDEDGAVPTSCAKCHSKQGFRDWVGADGTAFESVENSVPIDPEHPEATVHDCDSCHNSGTMDLSTVLFPSGVRIDGLGHEAICMQCHQGRESTDSVNSRIDASGVESDDEVAASLGFRNVHYFAAGATRFGGDVRGGYQYDGKFYDGKFIHISSLTECTDCHNPHSLEVRVDKCGRCHQGVSGLADLQNIRMTGSIPDYDGDGNATEGIAGELSTMAADLLAAIQSYALNTLGTAIVYDAGSHPYWFDGDGNNYPSWTARLVRSTYNYQYYQKDPGAFAHNAKYMIELLYDSLEDLGVDMSKYTRVDSGHFDPTAEPFRHWDGDGEVSASCARCHSAEGFEFYVEYGVDTTKPTHPVDGFNCEMCHVPDASFATNPELKEVASVTFPSGVTVDNTANDPSFLCMTCHQGRESKASVDAAIAAGKPTFKNIHYLSAGPSLFGSEAGVGYEYGTNTYFGRWTHFQSTPGFASQCVFCHLEDHTFLPQIRESKSCDNCHAETDVRKIRLALLHGGDKDWDGDGNSTEPMHDEVASFAAGVWTALQDYADAHSVTITDLGGYPYFSVKDGAGNNAYDAPISKALFNYQMYQKEPGTWAHNFRYIMQLLYDSIVDLGGDTGTLTRP
jgi:hypothetical protein